MTLDQLHLGELDVEKSNIVSSNYIAPIIGTVGVENRTSNLPGATGVADFICF